MRSLVICLYILVLGCMFLISYIVEQWGEEYYKQDISEQYLAYSKVLTPLIEQELLDKPNQIEDTLEHWSVIIGEDNKAIKLTSIPSSSNHSNIHIKTLDITDQSDNIQIISPLTQDNLSNKALFFTFNDSYSDSFITQYYIGRIIVYIFMTLILTLLAWLVFRYINQLSLVAKSVTSGNFDLKMPNSPIQTLQSLATDINQMAMSIEEKNTENLIMTGAIHHELRIPITRIRLALDMLMQMKTDETSLDLITGMDDDLEELSVLMEELLTISRLRLKGVEVDKEEVSIQAILHELTQRLNNKKITLNLTADYKINANYVLLERALLNIITNGLKYAEKSVVISSKYKQEKFIIQIEDDGIGIPEIERELILKPFYRTDKSRHRHTGGVGLGLAIADLVIKDCQGQIKITQSKLGGALITVYWAI